MGNRRRPGERLLYPLCRSVVSLLRGYRAAIAD